MRARADSPKPVAATSAGAVGVERVRPDQQLRSGASLERRPRAVAWLLVGVAMLALVAGEAIQPSAGSRHAARGGARKDDHAAVLPLAARAPVSAALGAKGAGYRVLRLRARNPAQHLGIGFSPRGVSVASGAARVRLRLTEFGHASALKPVVSTRPQAAGNRVVYAHGDGVREWYANGPVGLEQGFDLATRPRAGAGPLTLSLKLSGNLSARLDGGGVNLAGHGAALRYAGLVVRDARGRTLRAWFALRRGRVLIRLADRGARYPLRIDPFVQQAELTASDGAAHDGFGSVAVSESTIAVGAPGHQIGSNASQGAVYLFTNAGTGWVAGLVLTASDGAAGDEFGASVALSGDTLVIGAFGHQVGSNTDQGAVYVFSDAGAAGRRRRS